MGRFRLACRSRILCEADDGIGESTFAEEHVFFIVYKYIINEKTLPDFEFLGGGVKPFRPESGVEIMKITVDRADRRTV